jgi:rhamnosyltransferase
MMSEISILIPVKDGGEDLVRCLTAIERQDLRPQTEVVVVDSGSVDGSVERARDWGARVLEIPPRDFDHGGTRNLAASEARNEVLVFLSQDAEPIGDRWLASLTSPLESDARLAGVYGRQLPRANATPPEEYFLGFVYGTQPRTQEIGPSRDLSMATTMFSNANAAIRRDVWEAFPFTDDIIMSEDQEWARRVLLAGHRLYYEPDAAVRHSHPYTIRTAFKRFFDSGVSAERAYLSGAQSAHVLRANAARYAAGELRWLMRSRNRRWIPYACVYELAKFAGLQLGRRHRRLPAGLRPRLSAHPGWWSRPRAIQPEESGR